VGFDDRAADRKANAHAVWLCGVEGFEQTPQIFRAQPRAGVAHPNAHALRLYAVSADVQLANAVAKVAHRLNCVDDQIQHHLLQLDPVSFNARQMRRKLHAHRYSALDRLAVGKGRDAQYRLVEIERLLPYSHSSS
jgi:hypothetical protein